MRLLRYLVWTLSIVILTLPAVNAQTILTAAQAFTVTTTAQPGHLLIHFHITDGCYLYQKRMSFTPLDHSLSAGNPKFMLPPDTKDDPEFGRVQVYHHDVDVDLPVQGQGKLHLSWQGCNEKIGICYPPQTRDIDVNSTVTPPVSARSMEKLIPFYLGGLAMALTPCVWPMIPILSGIIARQHSRRRRDSVLLSLSYVLGTASSYALLGGVFAWLGHSINLAAWFQQPFWIITLAIIFVLLSLSLFDIYELRLPSALSNRLDNLSRHQRAGSLTGTFLMGGLAALVVSPCISAPLAGAMIFVSSLGSVLWGTLLLFVLGLGLGTPLMLLGVTQAQILPRSGAWMQGVKAAFGVAMLATSLYLLSRILPAPITGLLAGALAIGSGVALGGLEPAAYGWPRTLKALGLILILVGGIWMTQSLWEGTSPSLPSNAASSPPAMQSMVVVHNPQELDQALHAALGHPVMLDLWASWCISCQHLQHEVLDTPAMQQRLTGLKLIRLDVSASGPGSDALLQRFNLPGPPALLFLDSQGRSVAPALVGEITQQAIDQVLTNQHW
ncbi:MAG: protein-disulfide reductase DsbD [Pseudomonadales bacterium]|nr:protein-disulfide reductase DsbD [Pseudomonadales bacterium]